MKVYNIIALAIVFIMLFVTGYYMAEVSSARWAYIFSDLDYGYGYGSNYYGDSYRDLTQTAGLIMLLFVAFFAGGYIGNLVKVKTVTSKVMCIIGLSFTLLILLINFVVLADPGSLSFDESGGFFIIYAIINLAFFIVLLVQSIKYENKGVSRQGNSQVLDIEIE